MSGHRFGQIQGPSDNTNMQYRQCQNCKKVMFIEGDDYFNMSCPNDPVVNAREELRKKIQEG